MPANLSYGGLTSEFTIRISRNELTDREKVMLCRDLMDELGITAEFARNGSQTTKASEIISECWHRAWEGK